MAHELLTGFGILAIYFIIAASTALLLRHIIKIPDEIFRKALHTVLLGSLLVFVFGFENWWVSALAAIIFELIVYPILMFFERFKTYTSVTTERKKGEFKSSLLIVFTMFAVVIAVCWGWLGDKLLVLASVYAWGFGDAAAALIGKRFGTHKINWRFVDGKKSFEGTAAMFVTSVISVAVILAFRGGMNTAGYIIVPLVTAVVSAAAELYSKNGLDTVICPLCAMATLLPLVYLFGGTI